MNTDSDKPGKGDKQTAFVAQQVEPRPFKAGVVGSSPTGRTKIKTFNILLTIRLKKVCIFVLLN